MKITMQKAKTPGYEYTREYTLKMQGLEKRFNYEMAVDSNALSFA